MRMHIKKQTLFIFLIATTTTLLLLGMIFYFIQPKITVQDRSNFYNIKYQDSNLFNKRVEELGLWKKNNFLSHKDNYVTIKHVTILLTDQDNGGYKVLGDKSEIISSADVQIDQKGNVAIFIFLTPHLKEKYSSFDPSQTIFHPFIKQLFLHTTKKTGPEVLTDANKIVAEFKLSEDLPFLITFQK